MICLCDDRRKLLEPDHPDISVRNQCLLLDINRAGYYYEPKPIAEWRYLVKNFGRPCPRNSLANAPAFPFAAIRPAAGKRHNGLTG